MKTFILLLTLSLISCEDKETYCFECSTSQAGSTSEFTRCDITQAEADDIERTGTVIDTDGFKHPVAVILEKHTVCSKAN